MDPEDSNFGLAGLACLRTIEPPPPLHVKWVTCRVMNQFKTIAHLDWVNLRTRSIVVVDKCLCKVDLTAKLQTGMKELYASDFFPDLRGAVDQSSVVVLK
jgi:hypothetical protein